MTSRVSNSKLLRCAIYTRKSSEEGLEQDFNSLHAQRESCEAYIKSQKHEGWSLLPILYDDGGYSGGSMERPALRKLLADIQAEAIDVVVVYKVDRLTRSLADFAKIVEVFDAAGVSFVSVTQQFNTTTSMGRLTLNVLLSFAQFERDVTGERIRDKIAASKKKGMWMGGWVPIGYDRKDRTLIINHDEAETVRTIFDLFLRLKNVSKVQAELSRFNMATKRYPVSTGRSVGGLPFARGHIYRILSNPLYLGDIVHKGEQHSGLHPGIIDRKIWDAVQRQLDLNRHENRRKTNSKSPSLLAGLIYTGSGQRLIASHAVKNGKRYRYYIEGPKTTRSTNPGRKGAIRLPAEAVERTVIQGLQEFLTDRAGVASLLKQYGVRTAQLEVTLGNADELRESLDGALDEKRRLLKQLVHRLDIRLKTRRLVVNARGLLQILTRQSHIKSELPFDNFTLDLPFSISTTERGAKIILAQQSAVPDASLIAAIARGTCWFAELTSGTATSILSIAKREQVTDSYVSRLLSLALLPPAIVSAAVAGDPAASAIARAARDGQSVPMIWIANSAKVNQRPPSRDEYSLSNSV